jgi:hypothetical protein
VCRAGQHRQVGVRDTVHNGRGQTRRGGRVGFAGDDQGRRGDPGQHGAQVHGRDRLAAARVALRVDRDQRLGVRGHDVGPGCAEAGREPPSHDRVGDRTHPGRPHGRRAFVPPGGRRQERRGAQQGQPVDPFRSEGRQPHPDHPAEREPGVVRPLDAEVVEQRDHVPAQVLDGVGPGRDG